MRLLAMSIPDEPDQLPAWLEQHLLGPHLGELVAELTAVHGPTTDSQTGLDEVLGQWRPRVVEGGVAALPEEVLRRLLRQPRLLLALQELICIEGGPYWDQVRPAAESEPALERSRQRLNAFLAAQSSSPTEARAPRPETLRWYRRPWMASLATAAVVLVAVGLYQRYSSLLFPAGSKPTAREEALERQLAEERQRREAAEQRAATAAASPWGWNKPGARAEDVPPARYLERLADAADEWFNKRPEDALGLARRLGEFRQGCSLLIQAEHRPLPAEERKWLVRRCREWGVQLDKLQEALDAGQEVAQVRTAADETIKKLIDALRSRAEDLAA